MKQNEQRQRHLQTIRAQVIKMKARRMPCDLYTKARVAARSACLFYDASVGMMKFLPQSEKERYYVPFGVSWYLQRFLSLELSFKALRTLTRVESFEEKHLLNQLFDELGHDGQEMILNCSGLERQKTVAFLRKHANEVVDLRYYGKEVELTDTETNLLVALNDASILTLRRI